MKQRINLARYVVLPVKSSLDARRTLICYGSLLAFLMVIYLGTAVVKYYQQSTLNGLKATLDETRKSLIFNASKYPQSQVSMKLMDTNRLPSCNVKFSTFLLAFSKAIIPGTWLTDITLSNNGKSINLRGHTVQAIQAQQFLIQLKQRPEFSNYSFELTELTQVSDLINTTSAANQALNFEIIGKLGVAEHDK